MGENAPKFEVLVDANNTGEIIVKTEYLKQLPMCPNNLGHFLDRFLSDGYKIEITPAAFELLNKKNNLVKAILEAKGRHDIVEQKEEDRSNGIP